MTFVVLLFPFSASGAALHDNIALPADVHFPKRGISLYREVHSASASRNARKSLGNWIAIQSTISSFWPKLQTSSPDS